MNLKTLFFLLAVLGGMSPVGAQVFTPGTELFTLETNHFTIIFPKELQGTAAHLQSFAEEVYDEVAQALMVEKKLRLPVVLTPETDRLNGYFAFSPSRIVLYAAPPLQDDFPLAYDHLLRKIFLHELTHAVSLSLRALFWEFLAQVFSDSITPVQILAPWSFVEGVTVALESEKGLGRAVDVPFRAQLMQDSLEGRFQTLAQAGGITTAQYPFGSHYIYGGLFSRYLMEKYGREKYAALWKNMAVGNVFTGFEGLFWFKGAFEDTYGLPPETVWADFAASMTLKAPVVTALDPLSEDFDVVGAMDADRDQVIWADSRSLWRLDRATGRREVLESLDAAVYRLSLSEDGKKLLVSQFRAKGLRQKALVRIYHLDQRQWEALPYEDRLLEAAWLPDGRILATVPRGFEKDLVVAGPEGRKILLTGAPGLVPHLPSPFGDDEVVFLLEEAGKGRIVRQNLSTGARQVLDLPESWSHVRYLNGRGNRLVFSFDAGEGFNRMALWNDEGLRYQPRLLSGGLQFPVDTGAEIFYRGHFSRGQKVLRYPRENPEMALIPAETSWKPWVPENSAIPSVSRSDPAHHPKGYNPFFWLVRPVLWYPTFNYGAGLVPDGTGFWAQWMDPTEAAPYSLGAQYLWNSRFVNASFSLSFPWNGMTTSLTLSDTLAAGGADNPGLVRTLRGDLGFALVRRFLPGTGGVGANLAVGGALRSQETQPVPGGEDSPYFWPLGRPFLPFSAEAGWSSVSPGGLSEPPLGRPFQPQGPLGASFSLGASGWYSGTLGEMPRAQGDARLGISLPWLNFRTLIFGAAALHPDILIGPLGPKMVDGSDFKADSRLPWWPEFSSRSGLGALWAAFQTTRLAYQFHTDTPLPFYNLYMRSLELEGGYRSVLVEGTYLQSSFGALTVNFSIARGLAHRLVLKTRVEVARSWDAGETKITAFLTPVNE